MKLRAIAITASLATLLLCDSGWTQQSAGTQSLTESSTKSAKNVPKERHWSGNLVDVSCMAKTLASGNVVTPPAEPAPAIAHFMGGDADSPQGGQVPGAGGQGGMGPGQRGPEPNLPTTSTNPGTSAAEQAQMNQANKVDNAVKMCTASPSSQAVGLATSDGQVMQFDQDGSEKAKEALKDADVQPGRKIKAKVTGIMEDKATVRVAAVEVKTKGK